MMHVKLPDECQICERICSLTSAGMIRAHGMQRHERIRDGVTGSVFIFRGGQHPTTRCFGAGRLPYELSCDAVIEHRDNLKDERDGWSVKLTAMIGGRNPKFDPDAAWKIRSTIQDLDEKIEEMGSRWTRWQQNHKAAK